MEAAARPYRSVLYIPGSRARAIEKARGLAVDALILDLEDAVAPDEKSRARQTVAEELSRGGFGPRAVMVRINGLDTEWGADDIAALAAAEALLVPKVDGHRDIEAVEALLLAADPASPTRLWAMMETPLGVLNAAAVASHRRMDGFVMGTNDLAKDLGSQDSPGREAMLASLGMCLLAARAHGIACVDGVYNAYQDTDGLERECRQGRMLGFDGKTLIHPAQLETANRVFAPSEADVELARRQIAAFEAAMADGSGIAVLDGRIVENLHVAGARRLLARADAIAAISRAPADAPS